MLCFYKSAKSRRSFCIYLKSNPRLIRLRCFSGVFDFFLNTKAPAFGYFVLVFIYSVSLLSIAHFVRLFNLVSVIILYDFLHFKQIFTFGIALLHLIAIIPLQTSEIHRKALIAVLQSRQSTSASSIIRLFQNILCSIPKIRSWI